MLLNSVQLISSYPFEKIGIFLNDTEIPEISSRMGIRWRSNRYDGEQEILNWNNLAMVQGGSYPDLLFSESLSSFYDSDFTNVYVQPTNFIDLPGVFPLFFTASAIPYHDILLNFRGGVSAISIFPTRPFPVLQKVATNILNVSATLLPISAVNENWTYKNYYPKVDLQDVENLEAIGGEVTFRNSYFNGHKQNFLWKSTTTNVLVNEIFTPAGSFVPAGLPYDMRIVPQSLRLSFPISATTLPAPFNYNLNYSHSVANRHYLSGMTIESYFSNSLNDFVTPLNPVVSRGYITSQPNGTSTIYVRLNTGYQVPRQSPITLYYDTSATQFNSTVNTTEVTNNNFQISAGNPIYLYNHQFDISVPTSGFTQENAFTISYSPSALILPQTSVSSQSISTIMIDNYHQTTFPIDLNGNKMKIRFIESEGDLTLSAVDSVTNRKYISNGWFPASALINFVNNGNANYHTVNFQVSTYTGGFYNYGPYSFILNKDKASLILTLTNITDNSATVIANLFPLYDPSKSVRWGAYPPENLVFTDPFTEQVIQLDTNTPANALQLDINNLGVDKTTITLYSTEFEISASTAWIPSTAIYNNAALALCGNINDFSPFSLSPFSALFVKNNYYYPVPETAYITWTEIHNDPNGNMSFKADNLSNIVENTIYASTRNFSNIKLNIASNRVPENPQTTTFNIKCQVFNTQYDLEAQRIISIREYPSNANIYASMTASDGRIFNTQLDENFFFTSAVCITAVALTSDFSVLSPSNIRWSTGTPSQGLSTIFCLNDNVCLNISALSAKPAAGGFGFYDFSDTVCISVFPLGLPNFQYIAFPQYQFNPTTLLALEDNSYLNSVGLTGLKGCNAQNFIISAFGGFDEYHYRIGNVQLSSTSNIAALSVAYNNITASSAVSVSAYNSTFRRTNGLTVYNFASSNNSSVFRQFISFPDFPFMVTNLSVDNDNFDTKQNASTFFDATIGFAPSAIDVISATATYVLSSNDGIKYSDPFILVNNETVLPHQFTLDPETFFSIDRNSNNIFNFFVSGNLLKGIADFDICNLSQPFSSNIVSLSAYDGFDPELEIFTKHHLHTTNETVVFINKTPNDFPETFAYFVFHDGANHYQTVSSYTDTLTGIYLVEGVYDVSLSGFYSSGRSVSRTWNDYIIVKDNYLAFDGNITRQFPDALSLPHGAEETFVAPNEWQFATTINHSFNKIKNNFQYLSSMTTTFDITIPKHYVGWVGEKQGTLNWFYDSSYFTEQPYSDEFGTLKDFFITEDRIFLINDNKLEIRLNDFNLTKIYSSASITEGEVFQSPTKLVYNDVLNKIVVLDNSKRFVYVFDVEDNTPILTHYWGGVGSATSRTKLNNPTDVYTDTHTNILVVDADSLVIKIYNKFLNWTTNIEYSEWNSNNRPISITSDDDEYFVLTETGVIYIFDENYEFKSKFNAVQGTKLYSSDDNEGIIYIISGNGIQVFTKTGLFLNTVSLPNTIEPVSIQFFQKEFYILTDFSIIKLIDYLNTQTVKTQNYSVSAWNWDSIFIKNNEPVTDIIFNDSFKKIYDNLYLLSKDVTNKFVVKIDEFDNFIFQTLSSLRTDERFLSANNCEPLGINELVTYETINRKMACMFDATDSLRRMLEVRYERLTGTDICWSWKNLSIYSPHNLTLNRKPYSWYELRCDVAAFSPTLSANGGISWNDMRGSCCGPSNSIPISWTWENLTCCNNPSPTWEQMECGRIFAQTWEQLEGACSHLPNNYFDDCIEVC